MLNNQEKVYYNKGNILITQSRAEFSGKTFAMANITSVSMSKQELPRPPVGLYAILAVLAIGGSISFFVSGENDLFMQGITLLFFGVLFVVATVKSSQAEIKFLYSVNLRSASGEFKAMESGDMQDIEAIVKAIKQAIVERDQLNSSHISSSEMLNTNTQISEKLRELKIMLDSGLITNQEYDSKKSELLSRL